MYMKSSINFRDLDLQVQCISKIENKKPISNNNKSNTIKLDTNIIGLFFKYKLPKINNIYNESIIICKESYINIFGKTVPYEIINPACIRVDQSFGEYIIFINSESILNVISIGTNEILFFNRDNSCGRTNNRIDSTPSNNHFIINSKTICLLFNKEPHTIVKNKTGYSLKINRELTELSIYNPYIIASYDYRVDIPYIFIIYNLVYDKYIYISYGNKKITIETIENGL